MNEMTKFQWPCFEDSFAAAQMAMRQQPALDIDRIIDREWKGIVETMCEGFAPVSIARGTMPTSLDVLRAHAPVGYVPLEEMFARFVRPAREEAKGLLNGSLRMTPLGPLPAELVRHIAAQTDTSKPAYGQGDWDHATSRLYSRLKPMEPILRDLRRELCASVREWPRCRQHDFECTVLYRRNQAAGDPRIFAAFACERCLVSQPCKWNGKFHRDASTL